MVHNPKTVVAICLLSLSDPYFRFTFRAQHPRKYPQWRSLIYPTMGYLASKNVFGTSVDAYIYIKRQK